MTDRNRLYLIVLMSLWVLAFGYSFVAFATAELDDMGFTRGLNRIEAFLGWQAIASFLTLPVLIISRRWPKGSGVRRFGAVPFACAVLLVLGLLGVFGWALWAA